MSDMEICDDRHDPIVFLRWDHLKRRKECPVCEALDKISALEDTVEELEKELGDKK